MVLSPKCDWKLLRCIVRKVDGVSSLHRLRLNSLPRPLDRRGDLNVSEDTALEVTNGCLRTVAVLNSANLFLMSAHIVVACDWSYLYQWS